MLQDLACLDRLVKREPRKLPTFNNNGHTFGCCVLLMRIHFTGCPRKNVLFQDVILSLKEPFCLGHPVSELDRIVNMDQIPNTELFGFWKFYEYQIPNYLVFENFMNTENQIIQFLRMNEYRILNSTIWSQLFKCWILKIE